VFGLSAGCLASHVLTSSQTLAPLPASISFEEGAATPTVFLTVDAALRRMVRLGGGDTLLLHGAAGGVGLAAVQVAAAAGARLYATASNPSKRALLRGLGVQMTASSRQVGAGMHFCCSDRGRGRQQLNCCASACSIDGAAARAASPPTGARTARPPPAPDHPAGRKCLVSLPGVPPAGRVR
jgi:threonine dehydrogenase-like Zn-dependent dehydrogenase